MFLFLFSLLNCVDYGWCSLMRTFVALNCIFMQQQPQISLGLGQDYNQKPKKKLCVWLCEITVSQTDAATQAFITYFDYGFVFLLL